MKNKKIMGISIGVIILIILILIAVLLIWVLPTQTESVIQVASGSPPIGGGGS